MDTKEAKPVEGVKRGMAEVMTDAFDRLVTRVYDEEGERLFDLPGKVSAELVDCVIGISDASFKHGKGVGELSLACDLRRLLRIE